jgi:dienelactone hydrolase
VVQVMPLDLLPSVRSIGRGAATGALVVTLVCAAIAAENLHTGMRVLDWSIGLALVAIPLGLLCAVLRLVTGIPAWLFRRLQARGGRRPGRLIDPLIAGLDEIGRPWLGILLGIGIMVLGSSPDGTIALYHGLSYFEILIAVGALVGLLVGLAGALGDGLTSRRQGRVAAALVGSAAVLALATTGWAVTPGPGDPVIREDAATFAVIAQLDLRDPSTPGPYTVASTSYGSGLDLRRTEYGSAVGWTTPTVDASAVLGDRGDLPEIYADWRWGFDRSDLPLNALVWYPTDAPGRRPLVLVVHGNHAAADFSEPGYAYLGAHLASRGYVVASIDENYLNGDAFFDYGGSEMGLRAWLLLRHAQLFSTWDQQAGHPLQGRLDMGRVALVGHSRGGEAAALASMMSTDDAIVPPGLPVVHGSNIRTVIAFAPSDGMYSGPGAPVRPHDIDYLVIQGAHDGDLPGFSGLRTYHRVGFDPGSDHVKIAIFSQRANHGRFNSVWDDGDAGPLPSWLLDRGSLLSAPEQQRLAKTVVTAFLERSLRGAKGYDALFREPRAGRAWLPEDVLETHWETAARVSVAADGPVADDREPSQSSGFDRVAGLDPTLRDGVPQSDRAMALKWSRPSAYTFDVDPALVGRIDGSYSLVFSMAPWIDPGYPVDPLIELEFEGGAMVGTRLSALSPSRPLLPTRIWKIDGIGDRYLPSERRVLSAERFLQTHQLPLDAMLRGAQHVEGDAIRAIRFRFDEQGSVLLDDVGFEPAVGALSDESTVP